MTDAPTAVEWADPPPTIEPPRAAPPAPEAMVAQSEIGQPETAPQRPADPVLAEASPVAVDQDAAGPAPLLDHPPPTGRERHASSQTSSQTVDARESRPAEPSAPPVIEVRIGSIEVVGETPTSPQASTSQPDRSLSLDAFLDGGG